MVSIIILTPFAVTSEQPPPVLDLNTRVYLQTNRVRALLPADYFTHSSTHSPKALHLLRPQLPSQQGSLLLVCEGRAENHVPSSHTATHSYQSKAPGHPLVFFSMHLPDLWDLSLLRLPFLLRLLPKSFLAPHLLSRTLQAPVKIVYVQNYKT